MTSSPVFDDQRVSHRDGPAVVLIHGLGGSAGWWDRIVPMLAADHRVIRVELLGHGRSAGSRGDGFPIGEQAERAGEALDRLGVASAVLVGHSTGGYVATALAERRPGLVAAVALIDTGPYRSAFISNGPAGRLVFAPGVGPLLWRLRTDRLLRRSMGTAFAPGFVIPQRLVDDTRAMTHRALAATSRAAEGYLGERPVPERLAALGKPLLVIFGARDARWRAASAASYRSVPGARVEVLPGSGHSPMLEDPARTAGLLLGFIGSAGPI